MHTEINRFIQKYVNLPDEELSLFDSFYKPHFYPKKTILLKAGEICQFEAFVVKGCLKTYFIDETGCEVILTFATENWWVSDISSFYEHKPSKMYIETLEDSELLLISPENKEALLQKLPVLERAFRIMIQRHLSVLQERLFGNIALSAQDRYELFLEKYPTLPQRVPQHLIASYLGISPESLSRIRKKRVKSGK